MQINDDITINLNELKSVNLISAFQTFDTICIFSSLEKGKEIRLIILDSNGKDTKMRFLYLQICRRGENISVG